MLTAVPSPASVEDTPPRALVIFDVLGFQAIWLAWAWAAPTHQVFGPALGSLLFFALHFRFSTHRRRDGAAALLCVGVGFVFDTSMMQAGMLQFALPNPAPLDGMAPLWMMGLWACLACTLHTGLAWLKRWRAPAHLLSAAAGFLSYAAADRLGALSLEDSLLCTGTLLLFWGVFVPWAQSCSEWLSHTRRL